MIIRPAVRSDADAMAHMHWLSANTAYGRNDPLERRIAVAHRIFDEPETRPFVAEAKDGAIIGVLTIGDDELYAIYVHPDHWGTGVGPALLERAEAELATTCDVAVLTCMIENARARRFYERNGWEQGESVVEPHFGGEPTSVCRYRKRLSSS